MHYENLSGWQKLKEVDDQAGERVMQSLSDIAPDLGRYIVEFAFGEIYSRPGLSLAQRELATVAMLAAMGNAAPQLKVHIEAALNVGISREEIIEVLIQTAVYAGFPASLNAVFAAKEVFAAYHTPVRPLAPLTVAQAFIKGVEKGQPALDYLAPHVSWTMDATQWTIEHWYDGEGEALARGHFQNAQRFVLHFLVQDGLIQSYMLLT